MGRSYAGILAPLALVVALLRGWLAGSDVAATLWSAWFSLVAFALVGYVIGQLAAFIVDDSVRCQLVAEMAAHEDASRTTATAS